MERTPGFDTPIPLPPDSPPMELGQAAPASTAARLTAPSRPKPKKKKTAGRAKAKRGGRAKARKKTAARAKARKGAKARGKKPRAKSRRR